MTLRGLVEQHAPELRHRVSPEPARPSPVGYQLLPKFVADARAEPTPPHPQSNVYSWPLTLDLIARYDKDRIDLRARLAAAHAVAEPAVKKELESLLDKYDALEGGLHLIDADAKYNRFWQSEIAATPSRFARGTALHDMVVERGALSGGTRAAELDREIHNGMFGFVSPPQFLTATGRTLELPVYTDIQDAAFLARLEGIVEGKWHVFEGADEYRVQIRFHPLAPSAVESPALAVGAPVDENAHIAKFPLEGAVLTTGAVTTHAIPGRAVVLGSQGIAPTVLAHEFGHLLGLGDGYFRGYRDRGDMGYDVMEIVPDMTDIMCAPGVGHVQKHHFDALIGALNARRR